MEREPTRPALYDTLKRVGYSARLAAHAIFIIVAAIGVVILLTVLIGNVLIGVAG